MTSRSRHAVALRGEMTIFNAGAQREQLMAALHQGDDLEVDLAQVTEMDSAGLQLMLATQREAEASNVDVRFIHHSPAVQAVLDLADLSDALGAPLIQSAN